MLNLTLPDFSKAIVTRYTDHKEIYFTALGKKISLEHSVTLTVETIKKLYIALKH